MSTVRTAIPEANERPTRIEVALDHGRARITRMAHGHLVAARPLRSSGRCARIALVGINTALLGGDDLRIEVRVGAGATLEVHEPTGVVAYDADGQPATWQLDATVAAGATLVWHGAPFVAAAGSDASRYTNLDVAEGGCALIRETLVLGRSGETGIRVRNRSEVTHAGEPLLVEDLRLNPERSALPGVIGSARAIGNILAIGWQPAGDKRDPQRLDLAGPGALYRVLAPAMHEVDALAEPVFDAWRRDITRGQTADQNPTDGAYPGPPIQKTAQDKPA